MAVEVETVSMPKPATMDSDSSGFREGKKSQELSLYSTINGRAMGSVMGEVEDDLNRKGNM